MTITHDFEQRAQLEQEVLALQNEKNQGQFSEQTKIQASDKQASDYFGESVAISGEWAIVGAYGEDTGGNSAGAAYLFHYQNGKWSQTQKLQASDKQAGDRFGDAVAISGEWAIVGAYGEDTGGTSAGAAYIFQNRNGNWLQTQKIQAYDAQTGDQFGHSVAISGEWVIVGAYGEDTGGSSAGAAYIFQNRNGNWLQTQKLQASDQKQDDYFGYSVAISGEWALVGALKTGGNYTGAAYIFHHQNQEWEETQKLQASDKQAEDRFSLSLAISGEWALVGAPTEDTGGNNAGAAYLFHYQNGKWSQIQKLQASDKQAGDRFGDAVAISGEWALVGADSEDAGGNNAGAAYLFHYQNGKWSQTQKLQASDKQAGDNFGDAVAISGEWALVGAYYEDTGGTNAGAAYIFQKNVQIKRNICTVPIIDTSGSMSNRNYDNPTIRATQAFLSLCRSGDKIGVVNFGSTANVTYADGNTIATVDSNRTQIEQAKKAVDALNFNGSSTNMQAGIEKAKELVESVFLERGLVLLSDGYENGGSDAYKVLPEKYPVYTCAMGPNSDTALLSSIADKTKGKYYFAPHPSEMLSVYLDILGQYDAIDVAYTESRYIEPQRAEYWFLPPYAESMTVCVFWDDPSLKYTDSYNPGPDEFSIYGFRQAPAPIVGEGYAIYQIDTFMPVLELEMINGSNKTVKATLAVLVNNDKSSAPIELSVNASTSYSEGASESPGYNVSVTQNGKRIEDLEICASVTQLVRTGSYHANEELSDDDILSVRRYTVTHHRPGRKGLFVGRLQDGKGVGRSLVKVQVTGKSPITGKPFQRTKLISL